MATPPVHEAAWRAMGSDVHAVVVGADPSSLDAARDRLEALEARWSRFRPGSELCRVNAAGGAPVAVSEETFLAVSRAVEAWHATGGRFDPTVLAALEASGYDRSFEQVAPVEPVEPVEPVAHVEQVEQVEQVAHVAHVAQVEQVTPVAQVGPVAAGAPGAGPTPGCGGIVLDATVRAVRLPPGVRLDLGGIGKGLAADLLVAGLLAAGAAGACVNVGGDLRVGGAGPGPAGWVVALPDTTPRAGPGPSLALASGAVATSTRGRRRWIRGGREVHHLVDPATGASAASGLRTVTVVAGEAWWAEVLAKAAFVAGPVAGRALLAGAGATGLLLDDAGRLHALPGVEAYLR